MRVFFIAVAVAVVLGCGGGGGGQGTSGPSGQTFEDWPGGTTVVNVEDVSSNGAIACGSANGELLGRGGNIPIVWTNGKARRVATHDPNDPLGFVFGISADGQKGAGVSEQGQAFEFDTAGSREIPVPQGVVALQQRLRGVSDSGDIVVGVYEVPGGAMHFWWQRGIGTSALPANSFGLAGLSSNGQTMLGSRQTGGGGEIPSTRSASGNSQDLPLLPGGTMGYVKAMNAQGTAVGRSNTLENGVLVMQAVRWRNGGAAEGLGWLYTGANSDSEARFVSSDGSTIAGYARAADNVSTSFVWTPQKGMQDVRSMFPRLAGARQAHVVAMSGNGLAIVVAFDDSKGARGVELFPLAP